MSKGGALRKCMVVDGYGKKGTRSTLKVELLNVR